eukprot:TRINITY_DN227_c0_g1_i5.p1 TRINITY_DN227_c0_g1~~TRINITY_DN227_c0_g1_i5.p1  ORF type:complete len:256 (-),score=98.47 TRINITY_DN227_c0_g1_i5:408-1175(-)
MAEPEVAASSTTPAAEEPALEEESTAIFKPVVELKEEVKTSTGTENEESIFKMRAKLFRFDKEENMWKERGTGEVTMMRDTLAENPAMRKIRLLMRREQTLKTCLNHFVNGAVELTENVGSDRSWVWSAVDYADGEADPCSLAVRFANSDQAAKFKTAYDEARQHMDNIADAEGAAEEDLEADDAKAGGAPTADAEGDAPAAAETAADASTAADGNGDAAPAAAAAAPPANGVVAEGCQSFSAAAPFGWCRARVR